MDVQYWYADGSIGRLKKVTKGELLGASPKNKIQYVLLQCSGWFKFYCKHFSVIGAILCIRTYDDGVRLK
jgi:hypothetical protein